MATSLMQPVNLWHQRLSTAAQYLMVRLVPSALSYLFLLTVDISQDKKPVLYLPSGGHYARHLISYYK